MQEFDYPPYMYAQIIVFQTYMVLAWKTFIPVHKDKDKENQSQHKGNI